MTARAVSCRDFVEFLDNYLAGALSLKELAIFNAHLAACPSCVAYMNSYRASARLGRDAFAATGDGVPEEVPPELVRAILKASRRA